MFPSLSFHSLLRQRWLESSRDWCVSRQLWWGHRIPAYQVLRNGESADVNNNKSDNNRLKSRNKELIKVTVVGFFFFCLIGVSFFFLGVSFFIFSFFHFLRDALFCSSLLSVLLLKIFLLTQLGCC